MLEIIDLHVEVEGKEILHGVSLKFSPNTVHALMGPNGSGKSTLANTIMGHPKYVITAGKILLDGEDATKMKTEERSKKGLFLSFQSPAEILGVTISNFLRTAINVRRKIPLSVMEFHTLLKEKMAELKIDPSFSRRYLNHGFSGGEKKRAEILQLMMLEPNYAFLDETDSGLDVDAIKIVAEGVHKIREKKEMGIIVITHYNRFLEFLQPEVVSVMSKGRIIASGGYELAKQIENEGFGGLIKDAN